MHDGAVLIDSDLKITVASAILPLPSSQRFSRNYGTRHNAASEITARSDAFAFVVSETGKISYFQNKNHIIIEKPEKLIAILRKNYK